MSPRRAASVLCVLLSFAGSAAAQDHDHTAPSPARVSLPIDREGSGTSWLPDATPMFAIHGPSAGGWQTMVHGIAFLQYVSEKEPRGSSQFGSINWIMAHARKSGAGGAVALRGMFSFEPLTIGGCGYPVLLASGERCSGGAIVDKQHPHDAVMELAALYTLPLSRHVGLQFYGGPAGEPALGPVAFPHRISAIMNPLAPISHHWLDATHISYGVVSAGIYGATWKLEGSAFNGREPDEDRHDLDLGRMDSYSGRLSFRRRPDWRSRCREDGSRKLSITRKLALASIASRRQRSITDR